MDRFFWVTEDRDVAKHYSGDLNASHPWGLPGIKTCPGCGQTWSNAGHEYPCVDLNALPERASFEEPRAEPFHEFARLREQVRPWAPPGASLPPGTKFGPLMGTATGRFAPFIWLGDALMLMTREAFEHMQAQGVRGLLGCKAMLRFRQQSPHQELLELQVVPQGRLHRDCLPDDLPPPCTTCGRIGLHRPESPLLDAASLPTSVDLFRVGNFATMIIATDRFRDAVLTRGLEGIIFRELPTR
ncbi:hypothetical protein D7X30_00630 [Corallococcus sp. AB011P]|uniref:SitI6 family double-CXXCG motif immunity protein n=1 Tax=Corallococcus sp. AB011P TaxID=2316735 RepID=UPI000EA017AD|nr:double-CXXCG motif protein [Corallococcus sp. AB011P]RKG61883.1 hypothetical protein D7X30_00630 [Corallococcus sp. AB011P]